jgi:mannose-6-phosphate isomerase-like protein (cupin superfamily)
MQHPLLSKWDGYKQVPKEWGYEIWLHNSPLYCAKLLLLQYNKQCSLHRHLKKTETFFILEGYVDIELGTNRIKILKGVTDSVHIPVGTWHRFGGVTEAVILEVSSHHDDEDVERLEPSGPIS